MAAGPPDSTQIDDPAAVPVSRLTLPEPAAGTVNYWLVDLGPGAVGRPVLSAEEQERAARFVFDLHRNRYIACRSVLRCLLGRYLQTPPAALVFDYSPYGKPEATGTRINFNVSHSGDRALIGLTLDDAVGVDVEMLRPVEDCLGLAERFFSEPERTRLGSLPEELHNEAFLNCWTRKEAFIKALGEGLSHPLDTFEVTLVPGQPARLISVAGTPDPAQHWSLCDLKTGPGFIGACAVRRAGVAARPAGIIRGWD